MEDQALGGAGTYGGATGDGGDLARREPGANPGLRQQAKESVRDAREQVKTQVRERSDQAKESASRAVDDRTHTLSEGVSAVAAAFDAAASSLGERQQERLAGWTRELSDRARRIASYLDESDARGLVTDLEGTARQHPTAFVGTSFAAGLAAGRFLRASAHDDRASTSTGEAGFGNPGSGYGTTGSSVEATRTGLGDAGFGPTRTATDDAQTNGFDVNRGHVGTGGAAMASRAAGGAPSTNRESGGDGGAA